MNADYIGKLNKALTRADEDLAYLIANAGDDCGCECCNEWYVFNASYRPWHNPFVAAENVIDSYAINELQRQYEQDSSQPNGINFTGYKFPAQIAICARSFDPWRPTTVAEYYEDFEYLNGPDVRLFENYVY